MAKSKDIEQPQQTMEDFLLAQLQEEVILKDGTQLKAADGHVMTKQEAIATNLINLAMKGDTKASSHSDLSYPDKRDCAVRQRAYVSNSTKTPYFVTSEITKRAITTQKKREKVQIITLFLKIIV